ncbi:hypothetical protein DVH24_011931 [Malus domestica]|uniref:Uncharacterized protein n=1 Tax=Malus domestica TaxID=3750 RepID=A0A498JDL0_MALDO|nr:hypothetical protein DVH24_011931 [Malus domestica]
MGRGGAGRISHSHSTLSVPRAQLSVIFSSVAATNTTAPPILFDDIPLARFSPLQQPSLMFLAHSQPIRSVPFFHPKSNSPISHRRRKPTSKTARPLARHKHSITLMGKAFNFSSIFFRFADVAERMCVLWIHTTMQGLIGGAHWRPHCSSASLSYLSVVFFTRFGHIHCPIFDLLGLSPYRFTLLAFILFVSFLYGKNFPDLFFIKGFLCCISEENSPKKN